MSVAVERVHVSVARWLAATTSDDVCAPRQNTNGRAACQMAAPMRTSTEQARRDLAVHHGARGARKSKQHAQHKQEKAVVINAHRGKKAALISTSAEEESSVGRVGSLHDRPIKWN